MEDEMIHCARCGDELFLESELKNWDGQHNCPAGSHLAMDAWKALKNIMRHKTYNRKHGVSKNHK
jgi:hypothetical protein